MGNPPAVWGSEEFLLIHGGVLRAELPRRPTPDDTHVEFRLPAGGSITLARGQIREIRRPSPFLEEYRQRTEDLPATAEAHWEMAEWCRTKNLDTHRLLHLQRILEIEPNHVEARRLLGYVQVQGQWSRPGDQRKAAGYTRYRGKWRTPQEIQLIEEREGKTTAQREWLQRLKRWRRGLDSKKPMDVQAALERFRDTKDPMAVDPLTILLLSERLRPIKMMYINVLAGIEHDRAVHQLMYVSLVDPDVEIFHACMDKIVPRRLSNTVSVYVKALKNIENVRINRAAAALKRLRDQDAIEPLIDALVTVHPVRIAPGGNPAAMKTYFLRQPSGGTTSASQGGMTGGSFSTSPAIEFMPVAVPNQEVLAALVELSDGISFGFDQVAWRRWQAAQRQQVPLFTNRRD